MEYKKKSLNFMGYSREVRLAKKTNQRSISRHERFSIIRSIGNDSIIEENPTIDIKKEQAGSRIEMLQKWKHEKLIKKQHESKLKKPVFKVGFIKPPDPLPSLRSKPLFPGDTSSRLYQSSFQVSNSMRKPEVNTVNVKTGTKDMKIHPSSKIAAPSKPETKLTRNKGSGIQFLSMNPKVDAKSKVMNEDQVCSNKKQQIIGSKPPLETKKAGQVSSKGTQPRIGPNPSLETKKAETRFQPLSAKPKAVPISRVARSNIPSFGLPKATASRTLSTEPKQAIHKKNNPVKSISKLASSQQKGNICEKTSRSESMMPESDSLTNKSNEDAFECNISQIEPVKDQRKSFAPPGFKFQPLIELNSSLFLEDGPCAIFLRMKSQLLRTSTPKQSPSSQKSTFEDEDSKCLENESIKCTTDENTQNQNEEKTDDAQNSKDADNKLGSSHKYDLDAVESSSPESVYINDVKLMDCKQSLNFPEVASIQNQEEALLTSEITHSKLTLATEPTPGEAINPTIQLNSAEIVKTEFNCTDTKFEDDNKIVRSLSEGDSILSEAISDANIGKPIDCKQTLKFEFSEIASTQNQEEVLLSSSILNPENSLTKEPTPDEVVNPPILPYSVQINEIDINSAVPESDSAIPVFLPEVDPVVSEVIPKPNCIDSNENIENVLLKIPERKIRNFRQSEKPGLSSISESLENTPKSALKKKTLDSVFAPRRSLRLAKLSGNFSSLENLQDTPGPKEKKDEASLKVGFTPRRSSRLSKFSSDENLFDVRRPTLYGTPEEAEDVPKRFSRVTYDFDRLSLESEEETRPYNTRGGKISLLYTPPNKSKPSIMRRSIKGDLMSFSPNA